MQAVSWLCGRPGKSLNRQCCGRSLTSCMSSFVSRSAEATLRLVILVDVVPSRILLGSTFRGRMESQAMKHYTRMLRGMAVTPCSFQTLGGQLRADVKVKLHEAPSNKPPLSNQPCFLQSNWPLDSEFACRATAAASENKLGLWFAGRLVVESANIGWTDNLA